MGNVAAAVKNQLSTSYQLFLVAASFCVGKRISVCAVSGAFFPMASYFSNGHQLLSWDQTILIFNSSSMTNQHIVADGSVKDGACQMIAAQGKKLFSIYLYIQFSVY